MDVLWLITKLSALLLVLWIAYIIVRNNIMLWRERRELWRLVEQAKSGEREDLEAIKGKDWPADYGAWHDRQLAWQLRELKNDLYLLEMLDRALVALDSALEKLAKAKTAQETLDASLGVIAVRDHYDKVCDRLDEVHEFNQVLFQARVRGSALARYLQLLAKAEQGDSVAFVSLNNLIRSSRDKASALYRYTQKELDWPENWHLLVAYYYLTPGVQEFGNLEATPAQVRLWAAKAWFLHDVVLAKIVLAYCSYDKRFRLAVGDVLMADATKVVAQYRDQLQLPKAPEDTTTS